jgi:hypothetical protein
MHSRAIGAPSSFGLRALLFLLLSAHLVAVSEQLLLRTEERMLCRCHRPHSKHIAFIGQKLVLFTLTRSPEILFTSKRYGFMSLRVIPRPF